MRNDRHRQQVPQRHPPERVRLHQRKCCPHVSGEQLKELFA